MKVSSLWWPGASGDIEYNKYSHFSRRGAATMVIERIKGYLQSTTTDSRGLVLSSYRDTNH